MERISQDVALSILNTLRVSCIKAAKNAISPEDKDAFRERNKLLAYEEKVIYGMADDENTKEIVLDKIDRFYSPEVKALYAQG